MVRITILYPNKQGGKFDFTYYTGTHMPLSIDLLSAHPGFKAVSVERGLGGAAPGAPPAFIATCHYLFATTDDFLAAFLPHAERLQSDMRNYTDIEPVIQVNDVLIARG